MKKSILSSKKLWYIAFTIILVLYTLYASFYIKSNTKLVFYEKSKPELKQIAIAKELQFSASLSTQIPLVFQMTKSPVIIDYMKNPENSDIKDIALKELQAYQNSFAENKIHWVNEKNQEYWIDGKFNKILDFEDSENYWYTFTKESEKECIFNIKYDKSTKSTVLLINAVVKDSNENKLGIVGTSLSLTNTIENIYTDLKDNISLYLYNKDEVITWAKEQSILADDKSIRDELPELNGAVDLTPSNELYFESESGIYLFTPITVLDWTMVIYKPYDNLSYNTYKITSLIKVIIIGIIIAAIMVIKLLLAPLLLLKKMQASEIVLTEQLSDACQSLSLTVKENAATAQDQSAAVKEIVATMEDNNSLSENIALKIKDVATVANLSTSNVSEGVAALQINISKLNEIYAANQQTISGIKYLSERLESIWDIITLINSVAEQAKIIAFNAEIQASSAGESGKNFHVVATEIRRLADSIINGTKEIKEKINEIQQSLDMLIISSENGTTKIDEGCESAKNLEEKFANIKNAAQITANSANEITSIIQQQAIASEQILITLKQIASSVEKFSQATNQISNSVIGLQTVADNIQNK